MAAHARAAEAANDDAPSWRAEAIAKLADIAAKLGEPYHGDEAFSATLPSGGEVLICASPFARSGLTYFNFDDPTPEGSARAAAFVCERAGLREPDPADDPIIQLRPERRAPVPANDNRLADAAPRPRFEFTWFDEIAEAEPKDWIIRGAFAAGEFTTVVGKPGTGKSVIVTDAAFHVAAGLDWHGRKVKRGLVVYFAAERKKLTERRLAALRKRHDARDVPLAVVGGRLDMTLGTMDAKELARLVKAAEQAIGEPCRWIIIDTLTRTFGSGDQNASKDMTRYVASVDELVRQTGAHVTVVHHTTWNENRGKGAIDLDGAVDASFLVNKAGKVHALICDGANDGDEGPIVKFKLESVELGRDEEGEPITAPIVVPAIGNLAGLVDIERVEASSGPGGFKGETLIAFRSITERDGILIPAPGPGAGRVGVTRDSLREALYEAWPDADVEARRKRFSRACGDLIRDGVLGEHGEWLYLVEDT